MTKRIFRSICFVAIAVFLASLILIMGVLYSYFSGVQQRQLQMQLELAAQGVTNEETAYFSDLTVRDYRITWIDTDGTVLYDSDALSSDMENHLEREEIKEALATGYLCGATFGGRDRPASFHCAKLHFNAGTWYGTADKHCHSSGGCPVRCPRCPPF